MRQSKGVKIKKKIVISSILLSSEPIAPRCSDFQRSCASLRKHRATGMAGAFSTAGYYPPPPKRKIRWFSQGLLRSWCGCWAWSLQGRGSAAPSTWFILSLKLPGPWQQPASVAHGSLAKRGWKLPAGVTTLNPCNKSMQSVLLASLDRWGHFATESSHNSFRVTPNGGGRIQAETFRFLSHCLYRLPCHSVNICAWINYRMGLQMARHGKKRCFPPLWRNGNRNRDREYFN